MTPIFLDSLIHPFLELIPKPLNDIHFLTCIKSEKPIVDDDFFSRHKTILPYVLINTVLTSIPLNSINFFFRVTGSTTPVLSKSRFYKRVKSLNPSIYLRRSRFTSFVNSLGNNINFVPV